MRHRKGKKNSFIPLGGALRLPVQGITQGWYFIASPPPLPSFLPLMILFRHSTPCSYTISPYNVFWDQETAVPLSRVCFLCLSMSPLLYHPAI